MTNKDITAIEKAARILGERIHGPWEELAESVREPLLDDARALAEAGLLAGGEGGEPHHDETAREDLIERAAAVLAGRHPNPPWSEVHPGTQRIYREDAREVLTSLAAHGDTPAVVVSWLMQSAEVPAAVAADQPGDGEPDTSDCTCEYPYEPYIWQGHHPNCATNHAEGAAVAGEQR